MKEENLSEVKEGKASLLTHTIPAGTGFAFQIRKGQVLLITDLSGEQVTDLLAFDSENRQHRFSRSQTKKLNSSIWISTGAVLYSNRCEPMFEIIADTVGQHDMQFSPCGPEDNLIRFGKRGERTCVENFIEVLSEYNIPREAMDEPFGIFFNMEIDGKGHCHTRRPKSKPGDTVAFRAKMDMIIGLSACPQIYNECNGFMPSPVKIEVLD